MPSDFAVRGYETGLLWSRPYRPSGPRICKSADNCGPTSADHAAWWAGFYEGQAAADAFDPAYKLSLLSRRWRWQRGHRPNAGYTPLDGGAFRAPFSWSITRQDDGFYLWRESVRCAQDSDLARLGAYADRLALPSEWP